MEGPQTFVVQIFLSAVTNGHSNSIAASTSIRSDGSRCISPGKRLALTATVRLNGINCTPAYCKAWSSHSSKGQGKDNFFRAWSMATSQQETTCTPMPVTRAASKVSIALGES